MENELLNKIYSKKLYDLGDTINVKYSGIYSSIGDQSIINKYIHDQFTTNATQYKQKYENIEYFKWLLSNAFARIDKENDHYLKKIYERSVIFDVGSGFGNTIVPLLEICSDSLIIASDLSVDLLYLLNKNIDKKNRNHLILLQENAEELNFNPDSVDLIIGSAVLHHLFSPHETIRKVKTILKNGGYAIFFEPFENGCMFVSLIFDIILKDLRSRSIPKETISFMHGIQNEYNLRKGTDKSGPIYRELDDKWLFTIKYFQDLSDKYGFSKCMIYPIHDTDNQFENQIKVLFQIGLGKSNGALPDWAWDTIRALDSMFTSDMKNDLLIEGCIILKK